MRRFLACCLLTIALFNACTDAAPPAAPGIPDGPDRPPVPPGPRIATIVHLDIDTVGAVVGSATRAHVEAFDAAGQRVTTELALVTSSNPSIATVGNRQVDVRRYGAGTLPVRELFHDISLVGAGTVTLKVTIDSAKDSATFTVLDPPRASAALVVDSFTIAEYRVLCSFDCPYLAYSPILRLREPTNTTFADVVAVEFSLGNRSIGWCAPYGTMRFTPGLSEHVVYIDPYPYSNDLLFMSINGDPFPGPARARVVVRDAQGKLGLIEAMAPVQRGLPGAPSFAVPPWTNSWTCGVAPFPP